LKVSIILPTYNEAGNIVSLCNNIIENIPSEWDYQIIVVDDNSPDQTCSIVQQAFNGNPKVISLLRSSDHGLAKSIRAGIEKADGEKVLVMDTDFTHDPIEIPKMLHIGKFYDVVSGSRFCQGGQMQSTRHYLASFAYNLIIRLILRTQIQDNLGGYFLIDKRKMDLLPFDAIFYGYGEYFFRLLHYSQKKGFTLVEIPAYYRSRNSGESKSNFWKMLVLYTRELIKVRMRNE